MVGSLAVLVLATAAFSAGVVALRSRRSPPDQGAAALDREQVQGFVFVGATALAVVGIAVAVVGWVGRRPGPAEALAVLGLMAYLLYLCIAAVLIGRQVRPRRAG